MRGRCYEINYYPYFNPCYHWHYFDRLFLHPQKSPRYVAGIVWHSRYHAGSGTDEAGICDDAKIGLFMTSLLLPKISADFPDFEYNEMKNRANNVLVSFLRAITTKDENALSEGSRELKQQLENHIEMLRAEGRSEHFDQVKLHRTEIYQYRKTDGKCIITFQTSLECFHYITDENNQILEGDRQYKYQTKFNTDLIYVQDVDKMKNDYDDALAITCPNCGAPIPMLGAKHCEYCGCAIIELNIHAWAFHHVEEITAKSNALK